MFTLRACSSLIATLLLASTSYAAINVGVLSDFQTASAGGWSGGASPTFVADGGPFGAGDGYLQISGGQNLAVFNKNSSHSGDLSPAVTAIQVDFRRPLGEPDLEMRLALFGPDTQSRWTSTAAVLVPGDGEWNTYTFSVLEADLTQVMGTASYAELTTTVERIILRHDPLDPSPAGESTTGTLGIDNVVATPEPATAATILFILSGFVGFHRGIRFSACNRRAE